MREEIERKRDAIRKRVEEKGQSEGTVIATLEELYWIVDQATRDGILMSFRADPGVYQKANECYFHYWAMSAYYDKSEVMRYIEHFQLLPVSALNKMLPPADTTNPDERRMAENIKKIRRLIQARDRRRRKRKREEEQLQAELELSKRIEAEREEAADHRNDLNWLVARIESLGWEVTLRRKKR